MRKMLTILLLFLCFIIIIPIVYANPIYVPDPANPQAQFLWFIGQIAPMIISFGFLILLAYFINKKFSKKKNNQHTRLKFSPNPTPFLNNYKLTKERTLTN